MTDPQIYLVYVLGDNGRARWSAVYQGMPICAEKDTRAEAENAAEQMKIKPAAIWVSHLGLFQSLETTL